MRVDLHIHSCASDGCWTPEQIVGEAKEKDIGLIAVTDHDSIDNVAATELLAKKAGIDFIRGVEISSSLDGNLFHVLGYNVDIEHPELTKVVTENAAGFNSLGERVIQDLISVGYDLDFHDYKNYSYDRTLGGFKTYNYLIERGLCKDIQDWMKLVDRGSLDWSVFKDPQEVITIIKQAGGIAILAHPGGSLKQVGDISDNTLEPFLNWGIEGLEAFSCYHTDEMTSFSLDWCKKKSLCITAGSDCHGGWVGRKMGLPMVDIAQLNLSGIWPIG